MPDETTTVAATGQVRTLKKHFQAHVTWADGRKKILGVAIGGGGEGAEDVAAVIERTNLFPDAKSVEVHEMPDAPPPNIQAILNNANLKPGAVRMVSKTKFTPKPTIVRLSDKLAQLQAPSAAPTAPEAVQAVPAAPTVAKTQEKAV